MDKVKVQYKIYPDGTYSIVARVYNPEKRLYECPDFMDLTETECMEILEDFLENPPTLHEIEKYWYFIGD